MSHRYRKTRHGISVRKTSADNYTDEMAMAIIHLTGSVTVEPFRKSKGLLDVNKFLGPTVSMRRVGALLGFEADGDTIFDERNGAATEFVKLLSDFRTSKEPVYGPLVLISSNKTGLSESQIEAIKTALSFATAPQDGDPEIVYYKIAELFDNSNMDEAPQKKPTPYDRPKPKKNE